LKKKNLVGEISGKGKVERRIKKISIKKNPEITDHNLRKSSCLMKFIKMKGIFRKI